MIISPIRLQALGLSKIHASSASLDRTQECARHLDLSILWSSTIRQTLTKQTTPLWRLLRPRTLGRRTDDGEQRPIVRPRTSCRGRLPTKHRVARMPCCRHPRRKDEVELRQPSIESCVRVTGWRFVEQTGFESKRRPPARRCGRQRSSAHDGTKLGLERLGGRNLQTLEFNETEDRQRGIRLTLTGQFPRAVEQIGAQDPLLAQALRERKRMPGDVSEL